MESGNALSWRLFDDMREQDKQLCRGSTGSDVPRLSQWNRSPRQLVLVRPQKGRGAADGFDNDPDSLPRTQSIGAEDAKPLYDRLRVVGK